MKEAIVYVLVIGMPTAGIGYTLWLGLTVKPAEPEDRPPAAFTRKRKMHPLRHRLAGHYSDGTPARGGRWLTCAECGETYER